LTYGINMMLGQETDFNPVRKLPNGDWVKNSNFMRIRLAGRDASLFGPWDSMLGLLLTVGTKSYSGKGIEKAYGPHEAMRSLSSGAVTTSWDFISGSTGIGERVRDTPGQAGLNIMEKFTPFAAGEVPDIGKELWKYVQEGDVGAGTGKAAFALLGEFQGLKSSPLSDSEQLLSARTEVMRDLYKQGAFDRDDNNVKRRSYELDQIEEAITNGDFHLLPPSVQAEIDREPSIQPKKLQRDARRRELRRPLQLYLDDMETRREAYKSDVDELARAYGWHPDDPTRIPEGRAFRLRLREFKRILAHDLDNIREANRDVLDELEDDDVELFDETKAFTAYMEMTNDPDLEDPITGIYEFKAREKLEKELRKTYGDDMINRVQTRLGDPSKEHPLETLFREDKKLLKPYWDISDQISDALDGEARDLWERYLDAPPREQFMIRRQYGTFIRLVEKVQGDLKLGLRSSRPEIGEALQRWQYLETPRTGAEAEEFMRQYTP
jgi:hypothetical protein